ncbi:DUF551 domain-containing protein [Escherichia coli]|nr:DUF551 domain-containing protein [Escherichia coli]
MTTITDKELIKEIKDVCIGSLDVRDNIERRAYEIALASLEAEPIAWECGENIILFNPDTEIMEIAMRKAGNSPVTPDGWISCSERMPNDKQYVWCWGKSYGWTECDTFEGYYDCSRNKWWAVTDNGEEPASKVTHWMPLPEPPQEVK